MHTRFLILGQGLCGTWLSYFLEKAGESFMVLDNGFPHASSRIASGVINPVTGRRMVKTWMAEQLLPFAETHYTAAGDLLGEKIISKTAIRNFFPTLQMKEAYIKAVAEGPQYALPWEEGEEWKEYFNFEFGVSNISPAYAIRLKTFLFSWRNHLEKQGKLFQAVIDWNKVHVDKQQVRFGDFTADYLLCAEGFSALNNPFFDRLPFAPNKGEALLLSIPGLPSDAIWKKGITLVPWDEPGLFWAGSNYSFDYEDAAPTESFRRQTTEAIRQFVKLPFEILDHWAAVRPTTVERRPFVGLHPFYPSIGIMNGMGTKGCSIAPYFAHQLVDNILNGTPIEREASVEWYRNALSEQ